MEMFEKMRDLDIKGNIDIFVEPRPDKENEYPFTKGFTFIQTDMFDDHTRALHRTELKNELILDYDEKEYNDEGEELKDESVMKNRNIILDHLKKLDKNGMKYDVYFSGNKGFHINFYFGSPMKFIEEKNKKILLEIKEEKLFVLLRKSILKYLDIDTKNIDMKIIDQLNHNIRCEGSKHYKSNMYKTYMGSNLIDFEENTSSINVIYNKSKKVTSETISSNKYDDLMNELNQDIVNIFITEIKTQIRKKRKEEIKKSLKKGRNKNKNFKENNDLRPKVKELLTRKILDGRKKVLTILLSEMSSLKWDQEKIERVIENWNNIGHSDDSLSDKYIRSQIQFFISREYNFWTYNRIDDELKGVEFLN